MTRNGTPIDILDVQIGDLIEVEWDDGMGHEAVIRGQVYRSSASDLWFVGPVPLHAMSLPRNSIRLLHRSMPSEPPEPPRGWIVLLDTHIATLRPSQSLAALVHYGNGWVAANVDSVILTWAQVLDKGRVVKVLDSNGNERPWPLKEQ